MSEDRKEILTNIAKKVLQKRIEETEWNEDEKISNELIHNIAQLSLAILVDFMVEYEKLNK